MEGIIYNVTINIDESVHEEWLTWMKKKHIPDMLDTKKFSTAKMCKVLIEEEMGGTTYSVQYTTKNMTTLQKYYEEDAGRMRAEGMRLFPNKFVAFRTEMEIINDSCS
ncbi:DUF4286 family protein [Croceitalea sp. MTPC9]|uniref:DUF4286 family protein n=1 Tax=unclassified Croceitalea TaxID=2632280 RepID=UPI002B3FC3BC|nr:DUF4286 family protein [Croceitalea sp. MTPC6]GMN18179.1 DUF4286 family protein [Croceitalea sp. MTPC9]